MGYIKCKECGDYYELKPGEHPQDFSSCHCGGELEYKLQIRGNKDASSRKSGFKLPIISKNFKLLGGAAAIILLLLVKFSPKLLAFSGSLFDFSSFFGPNTAGTGFPYQYAIIALFVIAGIATKVLRR